MNIKKIITFLIICTGIFLSQGFTAQNDDDEKAKNLKVLPKDIGGEELHKIMREYSQSLGVRCSFCHARKDSTDKHPDFALDTKPEKLIARQMITMVNDINKKYIDQIGEGNFDRITCVTCHMGNTKPMVSIDSLPKKQVAKGDTLRIKPVPQGIDTLLKKPGEPGKDH